MSILMLLVMLLVALIVFVMLMAAWTYLERLVDK